MCRGLTLGEFSHCASGPFTWVAPVTEGQRAQRQRQERRQLSHEPIGERGRGLTGTVQGLLSPPAPLLIDNPHPCIHRWRQGGGLPRGYMGGGWGSASSEWCVWKWEESQQHGSQKHLHTYIFFFFFPGECWNDKTVECVVLEKKQVPTEKRESLRSKALNLFVFNRRTKSEGAVCWIAFLFLKWWFDHQLCHAQWCFFVFFFFSL